jgi:hypothetical protein
MEIYNFKLILYNEKEKNLGILYIFLLLLI